MRLKEQGTSPNVSTYVSTMQVACDRWIKAGRSVIKARKRERRPRVVIEYPTMTLDVDKQGTRSKTICDSRKMARKLANGLTLCVEDRKCPILLCHPSSDNKNKLNQQTRENLFCMTH